MIRIRDNKLTTIFITVIILFSMALSGCLFNNTSAYTYYLVDIGDTDEAMTKYGNQYSDYKFIWDDSGYLYGYNDNNKRVTSLGKVEYSESTQKSEITYKDKTILFNHGFESNAYYWKFAGETPDNLINCLKHEQYTRSDILASHTCVYGDVIFSVMTVTGRFCDYSRYNYGVTELQQSMVAKDVLIGISPITGEDKVIYDTQNNKTRIVGLRNDALFILKGKKIFECKINDIDDLNNIQISSKKKEILTLPKPNRGVDNLEPTFCFDWEGDCLYLIDDTDILDVKIYSYEYDENQEVK